MFTVDVKQQCNNAKIYYRDTLGNWLDLNHIDTVCRVIEDVSSVFSKNIFLEPVCEI